MYLHQLTRHFFFAGFCLTTISAFCQPAPALRGLLDSSIAQMQQSSLYHHEINWNEFKQKAYRQTKDIADIDSLLDQFPLLFEWLKDFHGGIQYNNNYISWTSGQPSVPPNAYLDSAIKKVPFLRIERKNDLAYYRVPGGVTKNISFVTQMLADSLCKIDPSTVKGWIIDLRLNTGGNIWFNLASLGFLIGDGKIGGTKYPDGTQDRDMFIKDGKAIGNNQTYGIPNPGCTFPPSSVPVVVIIGQKTASSAEGLLLAFKGRPNTLIIGEPTAGLITSNNSYPLKENITLVLATSYMKDRTGKYYTGPVQPDIIIERGDDFFELEKDKKIRYAVQWLQKNLN